MSQDAKLPAEVRNLLRDEFDRPWRKELRRSLPGKERMKIIRRPMPQRPPAERAQDFDEVNLGLSGGRPSSKRSAVSTAPNPAA